MTAYDVVVVGAGPAGAITAEELARGGRRVLMVEEHRQVGYPLHCSGLVTPRTLSAAGVSQAFAHNTIWGTVVYSTRGARLDLRDRDVRALVIDRPRFDNVLAQRAQSAGADLWLGCRLEAYRTTASGLEVTLRSGGQRRQVTAAALVGADGAGSTVARQMGSFTPHDRVSCIGAVITQRPGAESRNVSVFLGDDIAPEWFGWSIPNGDGTARVGIGAPVPLKRAPQVLLRDMFARFPDEFDGTQVLQYSGGVIPLYRPTRIYGDRVVLVGDAARHVKPFSGGGIRTAILGAKLAARTLNEAFALDDLSANVLKAYQDRCAVELDHEFMLQREVRSLAFRLSDTQRHQVLTWLTNPLLVRLLKQYGDIDFPGTLFRNIVRRRGVLRLMDDLPFMNTLAPNLNRPVGSTD